MAKRKEKTNTTAEETSAKKVCDLNYVTETMAGKKHLIKELMDVFLKQVPQDLTGLNNGVTKSDYHAIKYFSHTMKSSVSIMGVSSLAPILHEMGELAAEEQNIGKIKELNNQINIICAQATKEIEAEKQNYL